VNLCSEGEISGPFIAIDAGFYPSLPSRLIPDKDTMLRVSGYIEESSSNVVKYTFYRTGLMGSSSLFLRRDKSGAWSTSY